MRRFGCSPGPSGFFRHDLPDHGDDLLEGETEIVLPGPEGLHVSETPDLEASGTGQAADRVGAHGFEQVLAFGFVGRMFGVARTRVPTTTNMLVVGLLGRMVRGYIGGLINGFGRFVIFQYLIRIFRPFTG